jgi:hypothetical protein
VRKAIRLLDGRLSAIPYANTGMRLDVPDGVSWLHWLGGEAFRLALKKAGLRPSTHTNESWPDRGELIRAPEFRAVLENTLSDRECLEPSVFDSQRLIKVLGEHMRRRHHYTALLLCLLTFGRWFKQHGPGTT